MRRLWIIGQAALAVLVLFFVGRSIARSWGDIAGSRNVLRLDWGALALSALIVLAAYALLVAAWRAVLLGWGERLAYGRAARIWSLSNLARYVPGKIWQIAGMAAMAKKAGVSPWAAVGSAVVVQLLAITTGALVTGIAAPNAGQPLLIAVTGLAATALAAALAWPPATRLLSRTLSRVTGKPIQVEPVAVRHLLMSGVVTTLSWCAYGVSLYFFVKGVLGTASLPVVDAIGAFTASYLLGLLVVIAPGGIGVREGAIYTLLEGPLGPPGAFVVMVGSRILLTITELLAAALAMLLPTDDAVVRISEASSGSPHR